ncbi:MAG: hypothetical protein WBP72_01785, partial [Rhodocyclaceae bacterium]
MIRQLELADGLWLLGGLAQLHRLPFDANLVAREISPPLTRASLIAAAGRIGLKLGAHRTSRGFEDVPLPCIAWLSQTPASDPPPGGVDPEQANVEPNSAAKLAQPPNAEADAIPALILRADAERVLYLEPGSDTPHTVPASQISGLFEAEVLLVKCASEALTDPDLGDQPKEFGLRWFLPEFVKHKRIWRDVLGVSAVLQVLGL